MGRAVDHEAARDLLKHLFEQAEVDVRDNAVPAPPEDVREATERLFTSKTQAYREALVGCALVRVNDQQVEIENPISDYSENAFSGRSLDEQVVNPFLQDRAVPISKAPYLSAIRRGVRFIPGGAKGQKDQGGFDALVHIVGWLKKQDQKGAAEYLRYLLCQFVRLRDAANIPVRKIGRLSLEQYGGLIDGLLAKASGGLLPVILATAMFRTIRDCYGLERISIRLSRSMHPSPAIE